jgi:wobble nucleotide-excising tRNase
LPISQDSFYSFYQDSFDSKKKYLEDEINKYNKTIDLVIKTLKEREKNIFTLQDCPIIDDNSQTIIAVLDNISLLIGENNQKTISLIDDQKKARNDLRLNEVLQFIRDIDYEKKIEKINELQHEESTFKSEYESLEDKIRRIESEIEDLKIQLKDEKKGADKVNEYLNHFFGSTSIRFEAVEEEEQSGFKFQILRGNEIAYNLSEGERSLIAFCYFMAKLEEADTKGKEIIIWLDDPVSSLDNNHIFFVFSLIETLIAKPNKNPDGSNAFRYKQLYISTHNLEFLKYLKRLSYPKNDSEYFLLERMVEHSRLTLMPDYLKKYVTEFNYLFHQIYKCSKIEDTHHDNEMFYNFGNNLRKFLEAYLFYKYPYHAHDKLEKLRMFFKEDNESVALTNRISNELSHLEEIFDRSMKPVEIPEIPKLAKYILDKIKEKDSDQYCALLKSIGEAEA